MTKQEKYLIRRQIDLLKKHKEFLVADMVSQCELINKQISMLNKALKTGDFIELKDCT